MLNEVFENLQGDKNSAILESSTKLVLDWADNQKPASKEDIVSSIQVLMRTFNEKLTVTQPLERSAQVALVRSSSRLCSYWYQQHKSASLEEINASLGQFLQGLLQELK